MVNPCTVQASRMALGLLPLLAALAGSAAAQVAATNPNPSTPQRTVTWFADNPKERAAVELACLDDPGRLAGTRDCVNAHAAGVEVALRAARSRTRAKDPRDPAFWSQDPHNRRSRLIMCSGNPQLDYCDVARRSLLIEAGKAQK
jgi:hypothetical protein